MATMAQATLVAFPQQACDCSLSHLLNRAIDLIDPSNHHQSLSSSGGDGTLSKDEIECTDDDAMVSTTAPTIQIQKYTEKSIATDDDGPPQTPDRANDSQSSPHKDKKKKVRFSKSCAPPRKLVSVSDAIRAYDILIHAASIISSSSSSSIIGNDENGLLVNDGCSVMSWETLQQMADIYRALLVTSCLLMELLPTDLSNDNDDDDDTSSNIHNHIQSTTSQKICPLKRSIGTELTFIPCLSLAVEKTILSTSRRCILLLQALERICAAKTISQRHDTNHSQSNGTNMVQNNTFHQRSSLFYNRGDDIHDYDRSISDLYSNYDWHDDGYLPLPFSSTDSTYDGKEGDQTSLDCSSSSDKQIQRSNKPSNILLECCYRPQYPTDPPSSKHEKSAWTKDWIHGERIVSLRLEDYQYYDESSFDQNWEDGGVEPTNTDDDIGNDETIYNRTAESNIVDDEADGPEIRVNPDDDNDNDDNIILDISPDVLADGEDSLIDIMLPGEMTSTRHSRSDGDSSHKGQAANSGTKSSKKKRLANAKERRRKKRQRKEQFRCTETLGSAAADGTSHIDQIVYAEEGFLLLICDGNSNNILNYSNAHGTSNKTVRVFARLQPSGLLSIEICSIRRQDVTHFNEMTQPQPLPQRVRYLDFIIGAKTKCQPYMPEGASSFHFRLDCIQLLGASSLFHSHDNHDNGINQTSLKNNSNGETDVVFSVDEETGGAFVNGFEWVTALSGAAAAASVLQENIYSEWGSS